MGKLRKIVEKLQEQGKMDFLEGATEEQIAAFETEHSVKFPVQYRNWLGFSDGGECFLPAGVQFYGVAHEPLIDVNDNDRPSDNYIVIGALASGDPILWKKEKSTISIYNHEADRIEDDEIYSDFYSFLNDLPGILGIGE